MIVGRDWPLPAFVIDCFHTVSAQLRSSEDIPPRNGSMVAVVRWTRVSADCSIVGVVCFRLILRLSYAYEVRSVFPLFYISVAASLDK